jgi:hypothetical protein
MVFNVFCFFLSLGGSLKALMTREEARTHYLDLGMCVLKGQFYHNPQTLSVTGCLGDVITNLFWR